MYQKTIILTTLLTSLLTAQPLSQTTVPTKHNPNLTLAQIAEIQPGLGTIMIEFGHRFHTLYYAAKAKNWDLASYQLHELIEAQEVAETTRPKYQEALKSFEDEHLHRLQTVLQEQNSQKFESVYMETLNACNRCHKESGHPYIHYQLPKEPPTFLKMSLPKEK